MKRMLGVVAGLALAGAMFTSAAEAQGLNEARTVSFGVGGGLTMPQGDVGDVLKLGYHGQGSVQFHAGLPFALRADAIFHSMSGDGWDGSLRLIGGLINGVWAFSPGAQMQPYLSAGTGMYNVRVSVDEDGISGSASETKIGINGGAGVKFNLSGLNTFVEARYHNIFTEGTSTQVIPVTVGVMFR